MPFMSRFRKEKKDDILEGIEEPLEEGEEEGLLMSTGPESSGPAAESEAPDLDPLATPEAQQGDGPAIGQEEAPLEVADDELLAPARGGAPASVPRETLPASEGAIDELETSAAQEPRAGEDAIDELETTAAQEPPASEDAFDPMEASAAQDSPEAAGIEVQRVSAEEDSSTDDLLSAFRDSAVSVEAHGLTKGLEDTPMGDLLREARELRGFLPAVQADEGDGGAGGDGEA
jgi:hypothetical protein